MRHLIPLTHQTGSEFWYGAEDMRIYADPGSVVQGCLFSNTISSGSIRISGELIG